ncbi:hypothetical protein KFE25_001261 [Diacronema lutheri]|uniref:EF-hand domain-containing protein n=1 Tax=Diacronema lutheri TaxID=2081491 RepID=A0A8J5X8A8_DIALT|nr:hypothetical protein KFE25_001261 [Diacronema lutheri]
MVAPGTISAFGTDYDAVAAWAEERLPALEPLSATDAERLVRAAEPAPEARARALPPYLRRRSQAAALSRDACADASQSFFTTGVSFSRLNRADIRADPASKSGRRRAAQQARKQQQLFAQPVRPPPRRLYGSESALIATWEAPARAQTQRGTPSRRSMLASRLLLAKARADPRWQRSTDFRRTDDGWAFEHGAWSLAVGSSDPVLAALLDDRLRSAANGASGSALDDTTTASAAAHAQLVERLLPRCARGEAAGGGGGAFETRVHNAPPPWLTAAHLQLEAEARADDEARLAAPPPSAERLGELRAAEALSAHAERAPLSDAELAWRQRVAHSPWLRALLEHALGHFDADGDGELSFVEYVAMAKALYAVLHTHYDEARADRVAREDWLIDSRGGHRVGLESWVGMWMELAELWTTRVSLREYASFVISALLQITMAPRAPRVRGAHPGAAPAAPAASAAPAALAALAAPAASAAPRRRAPLVVVPLPRALPLVDWRQTFREVFATADPTAPSATPGTPQAQPSFPSVCRPSHIASVGSALAPSASSARAREERAAGAVRNRMVRSWAALETFHRAPAVLAPLGAK